MREAFALQKLLIFFQQKNNGIFQILLFEILTKTLTNDVVSFEQLGPGIYYIMFNQLDLEEAKQFGF